MTFYNDKERYTSDLYIDTLLKKNNEKHINGIPHVTRRPLVGDPWSDLDIGQPSWSIYCQVRQALIIMEVVKQISVYLHLTTTNGYR